MAPSKLPFALICISALLFSTLCVDATFFSEPEAAVSSPASAPAPSTASTEDSFDLADLSLPDFSANLDVPVEQQAVAAKLVAKQMTSVLDRIDDFSLVFKLRMYDPRTSSTTRQCLRKCMESYNAAQGEIRKGIRSLENQDLSKADIDIGTASANVESCSSCFSEMVVEDPELKKLDQWIRGITEEAHVTIDKIMS